ncbi:hypothetical protein CWATWH0402_1556 [Crocosphaera watsonii WH 0402]|uniref:Uncharacterized protein n=3 Tax=Crocosphaera watsonii TaxID=263511 RepID=T2JZQ7_CROWT|nr:hypothetical protein CWATWH0003_3088 [Crocosphaera watsonii WH 0003]CCQ56960.1 hypothetical protein CWATWH0005_1441 [Crocosphaera watsonii WH 0005]CCQ70147.1 hypothetical protein CWATWH0402_1556 [Crocosphaera watsonii WH 0402]
MTPIKTEVTSAHLFHHPYNTMSSQEKQGFRKHFLAIVGV